MIFKCVYHWVLLYETLFMKSFLWFPALWISSISLIFRLCNGEMGRTSSVDEEKFSWWVNLKSIQTKEMVPYVQDLQIQDTRINLKQPDFRINLNQAHFYSNNWCFFDFYKVLNEMIELCTDCVGAKTPLSVLLVSICQYQVKDTTIWAK